MKKLKYLLTALLFVSINFLSAQTVDEYIQKGDAFYKTFNHQNAMDQYKKAAELDSSNYEALWKISRAYVDLAEKMPNSTSEQEDAQEATFLKAVAFADSSIKTAPENAAPYVRRAIANGKIALFKGVFSVGGVVTAVRDDCEKAIALGNGDNFTKSLSHYILARAHAKLAEKPGIVRWPLGLGWGDIDVALEEYQKAIDIKDDFLMYFVDYAKALAEEDEYDKAKEMINKAFTCPLTDADDDKKLVEAKELLKELEDE